MGDTQAKDQVDGKKTKEEMTPLGINLGLTVGTPECTSRAVSRKIKNSPQFNLLHGAWEGLGKELEVDPVNLKSMEMDLLLKRKQLYDVISDMIELWVGHAASNAKLITLEKALKDVGCNKIAEELRNEFRSSTR